MRAAEKLFCCLQWDRIIYESLGDGYELTIAFEVCLGIEGR